MTRPDRISSNSLREQDASVPDFTAGRRASITARQTHRMMLRAGMCGLLLLLGLLVLLGSRLEQGRGH